VKRSKLYSYCVIDFLIFTKVKKTRTKNILTEDTSVLQRKYQNNHTETEILIFKDYEDGAEIAWKNFFYQLATSGGFWAFVVLVILIMAISGFSLWNCGRVSVFDRWSNQEPTVAADDPERPPPYAEISDEAWPEPPQAHPPAAEEIELYSMPEGRRDTGQAAANSLLQQISTLCSRFAAGEEASGTADSATNWQYSSGQLQPMLSAPGAPRAQEPGAARLERAPSGLALTALPPLPTLPMPQGTTPVRRAGPGRASGRRIPQIPLSRTGSLPRGLPYQ